MAFPRGLVKAAIQERKKADKKINLTSVVMGETEYEATFTGYGIISKSVTIPLDGTFYVINEYNYYAGKQIQKGDLIYIIVKSSNDPKATLLFRWSYNIVTEEIIELPIK